MFPGLSEGIALGVQNRQIPPSKFSPGVGKQIDAPILEVSRSISVYLLFSPSSLTDVNSYGDGEQFTQDAEVLVSHEPEAYIQTSVPDWGGLSPCIQGSTHIPSSVRRMPVRAYSPQEIIERPHHDSKDTRFGSAGNDISISSDSVSIFILPGPFG